MRLTKVKQVDDSLLQEVVKRIVEAVDPQKIILFGSYAYGKSHEGSDLDILVVMDSDLPRYKRSVPIYRALAGLLIPKDVLVYTPQEIEAWKDVPQAFITTIVKKGKVIYEKEQG
ncbi:MAG: nucleotidyltransferase domain-containing protein [Clostridia bacterium]|nr:nucleotidyltransferase domain-containing protein [Clostridia bacterium]